MTFQLIQQLGVAIVLASLIGLEREQKYQRYGGASFGGVRTFALIGLFGAVSYLLSVYSMDFFVVLTAGFLALVILSYYLTVKKTGQVGATSEIAAVLVYIIGIISAMEKYFLAVVISLIILSILHFKKPLHHWARHLKNEELVSTIQFIIIAFVILPLLPNQEYGPYGFFNPYLIWLMVVFISAISYASYIAIRLLGTKKGIGLTGFLAGFISSTALTFSFSSQSKKNKQIINPYVVAIVVASSAMFFRILLEVVVINSELLSFLWKPMVAMGGVGIASVLFYWFSRKKKGEEKEVENQAETMKSPFSLWPALKFGLFFALILFLVKFCNEVIGDRGVYITSIFSGLMDVDAITVSMANLAKEGLNKELAVNAITIAAMTNTVVKGAFFMIFGNMKVAIRILAVFILMLVFGGISLLF